MHAVIPGLVAAPTRHKLHHSSKPSRDFRYMSRMNKTLMLLRILEPRLAGSKRAFLWLRLPFGKRSGTFGRGPHMIVARP